jgi:hypothetical protein
MVCCGFACVRQSKKAHRLMKYESTDGCLCLLVSTIECRVCLCAQSPHCIAHSPATFVCHDHSLCAGTTMKKDSTFEIHLQEATLLESATRIHWDQFRKNLGLLQLLLLDRAKEDEHEDEKNEDVDAESSTAAAAAP